MTESLAGKYLPPTIAALIGSVVSGIIGASGAIYVTTQNQAAAKVHEERTFEARLSVVEQAIRDQNDVRGELLALSRAVAEATTELRDLRAEVVWLREGRPGGQGR